MLLSVSLVLFISVIIITLLSCISDVRSLRIPNWHSLFIIGAFIVAWLASPESFNIIWHHLIAMVVMFIVSYAMFYFRIMGGGDSKLATALGLWVGLPGLVPFILYMSIMGGVIGAISMIIRKYKFFKKPIKGGWFEQAQSGKNSIPYGIAIAFGFWMSIFHTGIFLSLWFKFFA